MSNHIRGRSHSDFTFDFTPIGEEIKFSLAKWLLFGVAILFVFGSIIRLLYNENGGVDIFESCKTILPPIATLVIGYYFSERKK